MNEIDFSQLEKLQKQMESVDYTKACASAMNVISQRALKYISNVTKPGHYKNGKTGGTLKKSWHLHFGVTLYPKKDNCIHEYKDKRI